MPSDGKAARRGVRNVLRLGAALALLAIAAHTSAAKPLAKLTAPLDEADKARHVVILLQQSEVAVDDARVNGGGGGLIGALIATAVESNITSNRQEAIAPVRDALLDFRFAESLVAAIQRHAPAAVVAADAQYLVIHDEVQWRDHLRANVRSTVLLVTARYAFEQNFDLAYVHALASLQRIGQTLPDEATFQSWSRRKRNILMPQVLHAGSFYSTHVAHDLLGKREKKEGEAGYETNLGRWSSDGAQPAIDAFGVAVDEIAQMIQRDTARQLPPAGAKTRAMVASLLAAPHVRKMPLLARADGRSLLQDKLDLHWVDDRQIKR